MSELRFARGAGLAVAAVGLPTVAVAALLRGRPGALGALVGLGLVLVLFAGSALIQAYGARFGPLAVPAMAAVGVCARLAVYALVLTVVAVWTPVDIVSLAAVTAVGFVVTLAVELVIIARTPACRWLDTGLGRAAEGGTS